MPTKITLIVEDETGPGPGLDSMSRRFIAAEKVTAKLASATNAASVSQGRMNKSSGNLTRGLLEASRGAEDFAIQLV